MSNHKHNETPANTVPTQWVIGDEYYTDTAETRADDLADVAEDNESGFIRSTN